jgi:hypothetical protein
MHMVLGTTIKLEIPLPNLVPTGQVGTFLLVQCEGKVKDPESRTLIVKESANLSKLVVLMMMMIMMMNITFWSKRVKRPQYPLSFNSN